jgi:hypothetical protein
VTVPSGPKLAFDHPFYALLLVMTVGAAVAAVLVYAVSPSNITRALLLLGVAHGYADRTTLGSADLGAFVVGYVAAAATMLTLGVLVGRELPDDLQVGNLVSVHTGAADLEPDKRVWPMQMLLALRRSRVALQNELRDWAEADTLDEAKLGDLLTAARDYQEQARSLLARMAHDDPPEALKEELESLVVAFGDIADQIEVLLAPGRQGT